MRQHRASTNNPVRPALATHKGMRVADIGDPASYGTVVDDGPQVSEVRWDAGTPHLQYVSNECLTRVS